jgi:hypothetical protein
VSKIPNEPERARVYMQLMVELEQLRQHVLAVLNETQDEDSPYYNSMLRVANFSETFDPDNCPADAALRVAATLAKFEKPREQLNALFVDDVEIKVHTTYDGCGIVASTL